MSAQIPPENSPPRSKKLLLLLIILIIILISGGGAAWYFLIHKAADKSEEHQTEEHQAEDHQSSEQEEAPIFVEMLPFTVNLPPDGQFLQATFTLQLSDSSDAEHLTLYTPQVRSQILLLLSNKTGDNLLLLEGKTLLTQEITTLLKKPLDKGLKPIKVTHVFITSFIIQ